MTLLEWLSQPYDPGPAGWARLSGRSPGERTRFGVLACFALAALALGVWGAFVAYRWGLPSERAGLAVLGTGLFLLLAFVLRGWFEPEHPFRHVIGRRLQVCFGLVFWVGRFVADSFLDMAGLVFAAGPERAARREGDASQPAAEPAREPGFITLARKRLGFLETDHGFRFKLVEPYYVRFEQPELEINVLWAREEFSLFLQVRREDEVFRPYRSRQFGLAEVANAMRRANPGVSEEPPSQAGATGVVDVHLLRAARLLRGPCAPVLAGDFTVLESIYKSRAADS